MLNGRFGDVFVDLGSLYFARGVSDWALEHYREALQIQREVRNQTNEAIVLNNIGAIYLHAGNYEDARTHLERALAISERSGAPADAASTLRISLTSRPGRVIIKPRSILSQGVEPPARD